jgi:tetratricopeptide (TPR) repeat protein
MTGGEVMARYSAAHLDDLEEVVDDQSHFRPVRLSLGITAFGATTWSAHAAGDPIVNEHDPGDPTADQELFVVLRGHAVFEVDGDSVDAPTGTFVYASPGVRRSALAKEPGTEILLIEGTPGRAYEPRGWELWAPLAPLYGSGEYNQVADRLRVAIKSHPQYALLFYNLACCESLTGRTAEALDHLGRAIELSEEFRANARDDADLDAIREEPAFREITSD